MRKKIFYLVLFLPLITEAQDTIPKPTPFDEGYMFIGSDDLLKFKGYAQADAYFPYQNDSISSEFLMRRVRFAATGYFQKNFRYMLYARFDRGKAELNEAFLESRHLKFAKIRIGQFKVPFSLYNLTSSSQLSFISRPMVVENFSPGYDIGGMLFGEVLDGRIDYAFGVFNGQAQNEAEKNSNKDFVGRVVLIPFKNSEKSFVKKIHLGTSYTTGKHSNPFENKISETGTGATFFKVSDSTIRTMETSKYGIDLEWLITNFVIRGEKLWINNKVKSSRLKLNNSGYAVDLSYVFNAEKLERNTGVKPKNEFDPKKGFWGAYQLSFRYQELNLSDSYRFLQDIQGVGNLSAFAVGLNWFPNDDVKVVFNYETYKASTYYSESQKKNPSDLLAFRVQYQF